MQPNASPVLLRHTTENLGVDMIRGPEVQALLNWVRPGVQPDWELGGLDRGRLMGLIEVQRVGPWLYQKWKNQPGGDEVFAEELRSSALRSSMLTELDRRIRLEVLSAMVAEGISPIPLKGTVLGPWLYGAPALRPSHDLDVLVEPRHQALAGLVLRKIGFRMVHRKSTPWLDGMSHEQAFWRGDDLPVELHRHITQPRRFAVPLEGLLERSVPWCWENLQLRRWSDEDQFLHLTVHAAHHQFLIPLLHWIDLVLLIRRGIDIEAVARRAEQFKALSALQIAGSNLRSLMGEETVVLKAGQLRGIRAATLKGLQRNIPAESDSRGRLLDRWHAFWLVERPRDRIRIAFEYALRWALDRPFVWRAYKSRQFRSRSGWRSRRFPLGAGLSNLSAGRKGSPQASQ